MDGSLTPMFDFENLKLILSSVGPTRSEMEQFTFSVSSGLLVPSIMSLRHYPFANFVFDFILVIATTSSNLQFNLS